MSEYRRRTCPVCKFRYQPPAGPVLQSRCDDCEAIIKEMNDQTRKEI